MKETKKRCHGTMTESAYLAWYGTDPIKYTAWDGTEQEKTLFEFMDMYAAACHMLRFEGDKICTKTLLDKLKIEY